MNCPRCNGGAILRTRDYDELVAFKEPYACASCGLAFDSFAQAPKQLELIPEPPTRPDRPRYAYASAF